MPPSCVEGGLHLENAIPRVVRSRQAEEALEPVSGLVEVLRRSGATQHLCHDDRTARSPAGKGKGVVAALESLGRRPVSGHLCRGERRLAPCALARAGSGEVIEGAGSGVFQEGHPPTAVRDLTERRIHCVDFRFGSQLCGGDGQRLIIEVYDGTTHRFLRYRPRVDHDIIGDRVEIRTRRSSRGPMAARHLGSWPEVAQQAKSTAPLWPSTSVVSWLIPTRRDQSSAASTTASAASR